jgi:hypothetical protein
MPLTGIQLLFETLVQRTRDVCKCEMRDIGSKDCNGRSEFFREPIALLTKFLCCIAKRGASHRRPLDRKGCAS